jgi:hypothetical protein
MAAEIAGFLIREIEGPSRRAARMLAVAASEDGSVANV